MGDGWGVRDYDAWPKRVFFPIIAVAIDLVSLAMGLLGLWAATSVAIYLNVSLLYAFGAGLALFPGVPLLLEVWHRWDRRRYGETDDDHPPARKRLLRSALWVNAALVVVALVVFPKTVFPAITTRGDWMFEGLSVDWGRHLLAIADRAEVLVADDNPYAKYEEPDTIAPGPAGWTDAAPVAPPPPPPAPPPVVRATPDAGAPDAGFVDAGVVVAPPPPPPPPPPVVAPPPIAPPPPPPPQKTNDGVQVVKDPVYGVPLIIMGSGGTGEEPPSEPVPSAPARGGYAESMRRPRPHALANNIPASHAGSYESVAQYIAGRERDPFERVKAIHDFIALRVAYDATFDPSRPPPSDPATVFERREAVCAGYARLFKAMILAIGGQAVYISGDARFATPRNPSASHAWNAVEIDGAWYLLDLTWNAGHLKSGRFVKNYRTDYLFPPPDVFVRTHFPRDPKWQFLTPPRTRGELLRLPLLLPRFFAYGLMLEKPNRAQITTSGTADFAVRNPKRESVFFAYADKSLPGTLRDCEKTSVRADRAAATCRFGGSGTYYVYVLAAPAGVLKHEAVARFEVNRD